MKHVCFGVVGFCLHFIVLTLALQQFMASLFFVSVTCIVFVIGTQLKQPGTMKPKIRPISTPQPGDNVPAPPESRMDVVSVPDQPPPAVAVPDIFDESRIRQDLARFANAPGPFRKYVERARSRFNKVGERAFLEQWVAYYATGRQLIESRTEMERKRSEYLQLANEHQVKAKEKEATIAGHEADTAEHNLRRDIAEYKRQNLERFVEDGHPASSGEPRLTPEQQRRLKRMEIEDKLRELDRLEEEALKNARKGDDRMRIENMYADKREELREQLSKNLV